MKLKPLLFIAGAAGAVAAVVKRRGGAQQVAQAMPQPVKDAAQQAGSAVQSVVENAPAPVKQAVEKVTPGDSSPTTDDAQSKERYEPPIEALAQEPAEAGGPPSDATKVHEARIVSEPGDQLNTPEHAPPEGAVMPDTSADDPLVRQQTAAAMGDAGAIGGNVDDMAAADASFAEDPAMRPVVEGIGDENEETFETREDTERSNRESDV
jgi:hypothetical protein